MFDKSRVPAAPSLAILIGAILLPPTGCGGPRYDGPERVAMTGKVTLDGQPVEGGVLNLIPVAGQGRKASAPIAKGRYDISQQHGPHVGRYRVEIHWPKPTGRRFAIGEEELSDQTVEVVPRKYNRQSTIQVDLLNGKNKHNFALTTN